MKAINQYRQMWEDFGQIKSEIYEEYKFRPTHRIGLTNYLREQAILDFLSPQDRDVIFDAGCASGRQLFQIARQINKGYGVDIAQSFIDHANQLKKRWKIKNLTFSQASIEKLPFPDKFFDKIVCAEVLEHIPNKDAGLQELLRILKRNGVLVITVPNLNSDGTIWGRVLRAIGTRTFKPLKLFTQKEIVRHGDAHVRQFQKHTLLAWVKKNHLKVAKFASVSYLDGPAVEFLIRFPLHFSLGQRSIISLEKWLSQTQLPYGRHLAIKLVKR